MGFPKFTEESFLSDIQAWIGNGGGVKVTDPEMKWSLLHYAAEFQNIKAVEYLINCGCDPNAQDCNGQTTLYVAIDRETDATIQTGAPLDCNVTRRLIELGASLDIRDCNGMTPSDWAENYGLKVKQRFDSVVRQNSPGMQESINTRKEDQ